MAGVYDDPFPWLPSEATETRVVVPEAVRGLLECSIPPPRVLGNVSKASEVAAPGEASSSAAKDPQQERI